MWCYRDINATDKKSKCIETSSPVDLPTQNNKNQQNKGYANKKHAQDNDSSNNFEKM